MTTITFFEPPPSPIKAQLQRVGNLVAHVGNRFRAWQISIDRRRDANSLAALDNRMLKDMGITRSEIISMVYADEQAERRRFHEAG